MSALGLSTMVAEAVLVRLIVPILGEKQSMRLGLAAFSVQCVLLSFAYEGWHLFLCVIFSMVGNLVYPSLSSLVSGSVEPEAVGESLGAVNGIKALTEGIGPLVFGSLMTLSEKSALPGSPYLLAALLVYLAYDCAAKLPDVEKDEYIHELERKRRHDARRMFDDFATNHHKCSDHLLDPDECEEYLGLLDPGQLSEVDEDEDESKEPAKEGSQDMSRLPLTFASMMKIGKKK
jgi:MFS family permease